MQLLVVLLAFLATTASAHSISSTSKVIPSGFTGAKVLILGDGDFGFSASLSSMKLCAELTATTKDAPERLFASFPDAKANCDVILLNGDKVLYNIDATKIEECISSSSPNLFDTIAWNFPHVPGKQNIKYNNKKPFEAI